MSFRLASVALVLALAAPAGIAAESDAASPSDVERMTPAQLRALQVKLDRRSAATRGENVSLARRIEELERRNATLGAKQAELETRLAEVLKRLADLNAVPQR